MVLGGAAMLAAMAAGRAFASPFGLGGGDAPTAETVCGPVRGEAGDGIAVFRGIPYGALTGGGARFMPPEPPPRWGGPRDCTRFGDQCPQLPLPQGPLWSSWAVNTGETEDCLALNVWTPGVGDGKKRPVMVWLHGGAYSQGSGSLLVNDGTRLVQRGDVVVVTVNHRLNVFGYLYLADIGGDKYADSGNIGQLDLIAALSWVRDNIEAFGGDPARVTIFGESGGGGKVCNLLATPAAKGLFHRAIIQSGPALRSLSPEKASAAAQAVMAALGASKADAVQAAPADRLLDALKKASQDPGFRLGPVVDGRSLPRDPFTPDAPSASADVPVIVGYNATETTILAPLPPGLDLDWPGLKDRLAPTLGGADADQLIAGFRRLRPDASPTDLFYIVTTDSGMGEGSIALAERKSAAGAAPAYMYRLEFETPVGGLRSPHVLDVPLVFDNVAKAPSLLGGAAADAQKVADQMASAWIAFARTGSPNAPGLASWPRYDARARSTMIFNVVSRAVNDPYAEERRIIGAAPPGSVGI
jgi:para-nitrobenzyl esterase